SACFLSLQVLCCLLCSILSFSVNSISLMLLILLHLNKITNLFHDWYKYSKEAIQTAINELKNKTDDNIPILTKNIDKILVDKNLSRTELSKLIKYDQSGLNKMIAGQISMSKSVISKLAQTLQIQEDVIQGWILAGKYSLNVLVHLLEAF
ncbi:MAG: helix-turn-helix transcriptional regulator, partial [bacterium]